MFGIRKEKNGNLVVPSFELYIFLGLNYPILGTEKAVYSFTVDCDWRDSRLPCLDRVLLCLVRVGLEWASRAIPPVVIEPYFTPSNLKCVLWANMYGQNAIFNQYWSPWDTICVILGLANVPNWCVWLSSVLVQPFFSQFHNFLFVNMAYLLACLFIQWQT